MKNIKIAFFDVDRMLIGMNTEVMTKKMEETLIRLKRNHVILCIATRRPLRNMSRFPRIEFNVFLTFNVFYCYTKDEVIFKNPISSPDVHTIIENAKGINRPVCVTSADRLGTNGKDRDLVDYFAIANQIVEIADDLEELTREDIYQMMIGCYPEEYDRILDHAEGAKITTWRNRATNIIPAGGGKGLGVEKIPGYYHLTREETIAFGDGTNDIEMLQAVGHGVVVGNAADNVKEIADDICGCAAEDGIYDYCKKMHLI